MQRFLETHLLMRAVQIVTKTVENLKGKLAVKGSENVFSNAFKYILLYF